MAHVRIGRARRRYSAGVAVSAGPLGELLTLSTVPLAVRGDPGSTGTGFFLDLALGDEPAAPVLVTARHVLDRGEELAVGLHGVAPDGAPAGHRAVRMPSLSQIAIPHPDETVDLAVIPADRLLASSDGFRPFRALIGLRHVVPQSELSAIEDLWVIGYPLTLWDRRNNRPLVRRGITATDPRIPYEGRPEFLVDAACFPGTSGAPVVAAIDADKPAVRLLGVLVGSPVLGDGQGPSLDLGVAVDARCLFAFRTLLVG